MKTDFSAILLDMHDAPLMRPVEGGDPVPLTLAWVASEALLRGTDERDGDRKYQLYSLALKVGGGGEVELKAEDMALVKRKIGEHFTPLVVGRSFDLIERTKESTA